MRQNIYNSFTALAAADAVYESTQIIKYFDVDIAPVPEVQGSPVIDDNAESVLPDESVENMTRVQPKVMVADGQLQSRLDRTFIGAYQHEYEAPHITVQMKDRRTARLLLSTGQLMESSSVDKDIIKAVQADMQNNPNKYIANWNENNPEHQIPLTKEKQNELPKKDESYKEASWYKESQKVSQPYEENQG
jgi:hypothetical protein